MQIIRHSRELQDWKGPIIIYGGGTRGSTFYEEAAYYMGVDRIFLCDQDQKVCKMYKNYVYLHDLEEFIRINVNAVIVITIKNTDICKKIYNHVNVYCRSERIYRYIPETVEEWKNRKLQEGFFNGEKNVFVQSDHGSKLLLESQVREKKPFLFARWGTVEGNVIYKDRLGIISEPDIIPLCNNAGVFPGKREIVNAYIQITQHAAKQIDILCVGFWCRRIEELFRMFSPNAILIGNTAIPPCGMDNPWTGVLKGLKVLVIHPFASLIEKQYLKREKLFEDSRILPEFKLKTYAAVQSIGGFHPRYASWIDALEKMEKDIADIEFDIALLGCGAYGMPLGAFIKEKLHKQAVHAGGQLQLLFGIKGRRWDAGPVSMLYNEYWVRPTDDLKPDNYVEVENGCYW